MEQPPPQVEFLPDDWDREKEINFLKASACDAERTVRALEKQLEQARIDHGRFQYSLEWHEHMLGQERARDEHNAKLAAERVGQAQAAEQFRLEQERREGHAASESPTNGHDHDPAFAEAMAAEAGTPEESESPAASPAGAKRGKTA